jgi:hypothetical protein
MMNINYSLKRYVHFFWGFCDALYILIYAYKSIENYRIPFFTDASNMINLAINYGYSSAIYSFLSFILHLSLIFSAILLLRNTKVARAFCYVQIPFRVFFIVPSFSIIILGINFFDSYNITAIYSLVIFSEVLKFFSLFKR